MLSKNIKFIKSPLNYTGGKYKLLPMIYRYFPEDICKFVDVFGGGANVSININARYHLFNDIEHNTIELYKYLKSTPFKKVDSELLSIIKHYNLTCSYINGHIHRNDTLSSINNESYKKLRKDFNENLVDLEIPRSAYFYVLILYGFNNQIRFNSKKQFNIPIGKSDYNDTIRNKLKLFCDKLSKINIQFECMDFIDFVQSLSLTQHDFVYFDPPYLISNATYNKYWNDNQEKNLLKLLDELNEKNIKFALSNVLSSKGQRNILLIEWSKKYTTIPIKCSYKNSNYKRTFLGEDEEVLIINY